MEVTFSETKEKQVVGRLNSGKKAFIVKDYSSFKIKHGEVWDCEIHKDFPRHCEVIPKKCIINASSNEQIMEDKINLLIKHSKENGIKIGKL